MSYLVLARKYRPQTFEHVIQQEHVTRTLANAISMGRVAHAILFSGPRGTGKTTVARILAKAMSCEKGPSPEPCNQCRSCREITAGNAVDVLEIDGASNNGVDQIRELRENVKYMPAHSRYKIYIIDEVHMLSIGAFNALLKTLEEPPSHVLFMFATTEAHKIPITILSRCQRHDLRRIDASSVSAHLERICREEGIEIGRESLWRIAHEAGGSMRDALSLLDLVMSASEGPVTHEQILGLLGVIDRKVLFDLSSAVIRADAQAVLQILDEVYDRGNDLKKFYSDLMEHFRNLLVVRLGKMVPELVDLPPAEIDRMREQAEPVSPFFLHQILDLLFKQESGFRYSTHPKLAFETVLLRVLQLRPTLPIDSLIQKLDDLRREVHEPQPSPRDERAASTDFRQAGDEKEVPDSAPATPTPAPTPTPTSASETPSGDPESVWKRLLETVSEKSRSVGSILAQGTLKSISGNRLEIEIPENTFNQNRVAKNLDMIRQACRMVFGREMDPKIGTFRDASPQAKKNDAGRLDDEALQHPMVNEALEIFGGRLVPR